MLKVSQLHSVPHTKNRSDANRLARNVRIPHKSFVTFVVVFSSASLAHARITRTLHAVSLPFLLFLYGGTWPLCPFQVSEPNSVPFRFLLSLSSFRSIRSSNIAEDCRGSPTPTRDHRLSSASGFVSDHWLAEQDDGEGEQWCYF